MKKLFTFFAAVSLLTAFTPMALASDYFFYTYDGHTLEYNIKSSNEAEVAEQGNNDLSGSVTIPSTVTYNNTTYTVTSIVNSAFRGCTGLTSINIPNSVTSIGHSAFKNCSGLTGTFTIPNSVTYIGNYAFDSCSGLTSVTIGNSVTSIGIYAFSGCTGLISVYYTGDVAGWCGISFLWSSQSNPLYYGHNLYINNSLVTDLVIPNTVDTIRDNAFVACTSLTSVTIPNSVTYIGVEAFYGCTGLTGTLTIPNSVTVIDNWAFRDCSGLSGTLTIPNSVTYIGAYAFIDCSGLSGTLTIGNSVTTIDFEAFNGCTGITEITCNRNVPPTLHHNNSYGYGYAFDDFPTSTPVYIPCGRTPYYAAADGWSRFTNFIEMGEVAFSAVSADNNMGTVQILTMPTCTNPQAVVYATPSSGYQFDHWSDNSTTNPYTLTVTEDLTLTAYFSPIGSDPTTYYTITVATNDPSMGTVSGGGSYAANTTATITAIANSGYHFVQWQDGNTQASRSVTVTSDAEYTAYFAANSANEYTITVISQNPAMGSTTGSGTFEYGTVTTITAEPYEGYNFVQWQDGNTQRIRTITVTGNATYTAYFDGANGIDDVADADGVKVYAKGGRIVIDFSGQQAAVSRQSIVVYDVMGRVIKQAAGSGQQAAVEIPVTSAGVYMVKVGEQPSRKVLVRP